MSVDFKSQRILVLSGTNEFTLSVVTGTTPVTTEPSGSIARAIDGSLWRSLDGGNWTSIGSTMAISGSITGGPVVNCMLFVNSGSILGQSYPMTWDSVQKRLTIIQSAADPANGTGAITLQNTLSTALVQMCFQNAGGTFKASFGYNNNVNQTYFYMNTGVDYLLQLGNGATVHAFKSDGGVGINESSPPAATAYQMQITQTRSGGEVLKLRGTQTNNHVDMCCFDSSNVQKNGFGYANSATGNSLASLNFFYTPSVDFVMSNSTVNFFRWYTTSGSVGYEMLDGGSAAASLVGTGKIRYNNTTRRFNASTNTGAYKDILTGSFSAAGSVVFSDSNGNIAENNANLKWDDTNGRFRIGADAITNPQAFPLTVSVSQADIVSYMWNTNTAGWGAIGFLDNARTWRSIFGYANSTSGGSQRQSKTFISTNANDFVYTDNVPNVLFTFGMTSGSATFQLAAGSTGSVSATGTAKIRYNEATNVLEVSKNGAAYVTIV